MKYKNFGEKQHSYWFYLWICIFLVVVIIGTMVSMSFLWQRLELYEKDTPTYALDGYVNMLKQKKFDEILATADFTETEFCKKPQQIEYLKNHYDADLNDAVYLKVVGKEHKANTQYYEIHSGKSGETNLGVVELTENADKSKGKWTVKPPKPEFLEPLFIDAPTYTEVFANDIKLTKSHMEKENIPLEQFSGIRNAGEMPTMCRYKVEGFIEKPTITAKIIGGEDSADCTIVEKDGNASVVSYLPDEKQKEYQAVISECAQAYAKFITRDGELATVRKYIYKDCDFYKSLGSFQNKWYNTHDGYRFENIQTQKVIQYSQNHFSCEISFDYITKRQGKDFVYPTKYEMTLVLSNGKPLVSGLLTK